MSAAERSRRDWRRHRQRQHRRQRLQELLGRNGEMQRELAGRFLGVSVRRCSEMKLMVDVVCTCVAAHAERVVLAEVFLHAADLQKATEMAACVIELEIGDAGIDLLTQLCDYK